MSTFAIYYRKNANFEMDNRLKVADIHFDNFGYVKTIEADSLNDVFYQMQGEVWSPNGEAYELIRKANLDHTSMSVGDVAYDIEHMVYYQVDRYGWRQVPSY